MCVGSVMVSCWWCNTWFDAMSDSICSQFEPKMSWAELSWTEPFTKCWVFSAHFALEVPKSINQSINHHQQQRLMNPIQEKRREESQSLTIKNVVGFQSNIVSSSSTFLHLTYQSSIWQQLHESTIASDWSIVNWQQLHESTKPVHEFCQASPEREREREIKGSWL